MFFAGSDGNQGFSDTVAPMEGLSSRPQRAKSVWFDFVVKTGAQPVAQGFASLSAPRLQAQTVYFSTTGFCPSRLVNSTQDVCGLIMPPGNYRFRTESERLSLPKNTVPPTINLICRCRVLETSSCGYAMWFAKFFGSSFAVSPGTYL